MSVNYLPFDQRKPDTQYRDRLRLILEEGEPSESFHTEGSTMYMAPPPLRYNLANGIPLITERSMKGIWKSAFAELIAFLNGVRTQKRLLEYGVNEKFWGPFVTKEKCSMFNLVEGDLGPGSYGPGFDRIDRNGVASNQLANVIHQIKTMPQVRTHFIDPWIPELCVPRPGEKRGVVVAPCHGWMHFRIVKGRLDLHMFQRSADMPVGVPSNIFQYAALLVAVAHVLKMPAGYYYHSFSDAHVYEHSKVEDDADVTTGITQRDAIQEMLSREPRRFPTLTISDDAPDNLFEFRPHHLILTDYDPHPPIKGIEVAI